MDEHKECSPDEDESLRILIVDDDADFVESLVDILETRGYQLATAHSIEEALGKGREFEAQVSLIDIRLGRSSGIGLIGELKSLLPNILCVMMTAYADVENAVEALQEGAYNYLRKPLSVRDLLATLDRCFERLRLQTEKETAERALRLRNQELEEINARLRKIVDSTKGFSFSSRWGEMGPVLLEEFAHNMAAGGGSLFLREGDGLVLVHTLDPGHTPATIAFPLRKGSIFEQAMSTGEPVLIRDINEAGDVVSSGWKGYQSGSLLVFPLPDEKGEVVGIISLHNKVPTPFTSQDRELGSILASFGCESIRATRAVEALRQSEERYRTILESIKEGYFEMNLKGKFTFFNDALCEIMGYSRSELMKMSSREYTTPEASQKLYQIFAEIVQTGKHASVTDYEIIRKDGSVRHIELSTSLMHDSSKRPVGFRGVARDITERKLAEEDRRRLAAAVEHAGESIIITNKDGAIQYVNPAFERTSGYCREEVIGRDFRILKNEKNSDYLFEDMWRTLRRGESWSGHITNTKKDGNPCQFETTISPIRDGFGRIVGFVSVNRDVTHEVELENQLRQAQKMEAVGTLAGGIAHDFNNLLQAVLGYGELLLLGKKETQPGYRELQEIVRAGKRGGELTQQLLTFSRKVDSERRPISLNAEILDVRSMLVRTIPKMIEIELDLEKDLRTVSADPIQIGQVLMNLAVNAKDAMPKGGKLTLKTVNVSVDKDPWKVHPEAKPGLYVLLRISDTGHGMSKEVMEHIFEPFYTTKDPGRGTGLGLAMVYGIIRNHDGYITCRSQPDEGTTFDIFLPAAERTDEGQRPLKEEIPVKAGSETILLVDDEEYIRDLGIRALFRFGYTVVAVPDGESAMEIYRQEQGKIHLLILDLIMPGMGGMRCLEEILKINPKAKILVSSGYGPDGAVEQAMGAGAKGFIGKPFEVQELVKVIRKVLDED